MPETRTRTYGITVFATADGDLAWFGTATAPDLEDLVTELHQRFPAPAFRVEINR